MSRTDLKKIIGWYVAFAIIYGFVVAGFTSTVHMNVDEELYLSMARSFHYNGCFEAAGTKVSYSCVLYSMLISLAYYLYTPETILFVMRFIGVITMTSSIFPIWLLTKKILKNDRLSLRVTVLSMLFPFMFDTAYIMQEVLAYPLFLWLAVLLLYAYEEKKMRYFILSALFSVLCFFTKTYFFFVPITVNIVQFLETIFSNRKEEKSEWKGILAYDITYVLGFGALYVILYIGNGLGQGGNHYSNQFAQLFPVTISTTICAASCCIFYMSFLIVNTGVVPFAALLNRQKKAQTSERKFWQFIFISIVFLVIEIVVMIVLTEEGNVWMPHKYLFRYFQVFSVPLLVAFVATEGNEKEWMTKGQKSLLGFAGVITVLYWTVMCRNTRHGIIDGHLVVALENMNRIIPYASVGAVLCFVLVVFFIRKNKKLYKTFAVVVVVVFWVLNMVQLPYYTNVIADGNRIEHDAIQIAEYLNEMDDCVVCYVRNEGLSPYAQNCYGFFRQPFVAIDEENVGEYADNEHYVFVTVASGDIQRNLEKAGFEKVALETDLLYLYTNVIMKNSDNI